MPRVKREDELDLVDWQIVHAFRANRALMRRKGVHPNLRARLTQLLPDLERRAADRGIPVDLLMKWRDYPARDAGALTFGVRADGEQIEHVPPPTARRRRRRDDLPPVTKSGGEALSDLEDVLARSIALAQSNGSEPHLNVSSDPLTSVDDVHTIVSTSSIERDRGTDSQKGVTHMATATEKSELLKRHQRLIAEYASSVGAIRAHTVRRINELELDMTLEGIEFTPWTKPEPTRSYGKSLDELREGLSQLEALMARKDVPDRIKATASTRAERLKAQIANRTTSETVAS